MESARKADANETAALWHANSAVREAEFGNNAVARREAVAALALLPGRDVRSIAALALARAGDAGQARKLADRLNQEFPYNTLIQEYWLPSIRAAMEMNSSHGDAALDVLKGSSSLKLGQSQPFSLGMMYPVYLRGQVYLYYRAGPRSGRAVPEDPAT